MWVRVGAIQTRPSGRAKRPGGARNRWSIATRLSLTFYRSSFLFSKDILSFFL